MPKVKATIHSFPATGFVHLEEDGDRGFFMFDDNIEGKSSTEEERIIGVYKLVKVVKLKRAVSEIVDL